MFQSFRARFPAGRSFQWITKALAALVFTSGARGAAANDEVPWRAQAVGTVTASVERPDGSLLIDAVTTGVCSHLGESTTTVRSVGRPGTDAAGRPIFTTTGDGTIQAAGGDKIYLTFHTAQRQDGGPPLPFEGGLEVVAGTGRFLGARGRAAISGLDQGGGHFVYIFEGTLSSPGASRKHGPPPAPVVPENLEAPEGQAVLFHALGKGVQIYTCGPAAGDPTRFVWTFKAPEADLLNDEGEKLGIHYAGPTWESNGGSKVAAAVLERSPSPDPGAIPWLLLQARSNEGAGAMSAVAYIQRTSTTGGLAPAEGCDEAHAGAEVRVDYSALYHFFGLAR